MSGAKVGVQHLLGVSHSLLLRSGLSRKEGRGEGAFNRARKTAEKEANTRSTYQMKIEGGRARATTSNTKFEQTQRGRGQVQTSTAAVLRPATEHITLPATRHMLRGERCAFEDGV